MCSFYIEIRAPGDKDLIAVRLCDCFRLSNAPTPMMNANQARCPGCKKNFTLNGLSQHVSKTQRARCWAAHAASQPATAFRPTHLRSPLMIPLNPMTAPPEPISSTDDAPGLNGISYDSPGVNGNQYDSPADTDDGQILLQSCGPLTNCKGFRWHWCAW